VISAASAPLATAATTAINMDEDFDRLISLLFPRRRRCSPSFMLIILLITLLCNSLNLFFQSHIKYIDGTERAPTYY
jgi:hypothetical protein